MRCNKKPLGATGVYTEIGLTIRFLLTRVGGGREGLLEGLRGRGRGARGTGSGGAAGWRGRGGKKRPTNAARESSPASTRRS
jgi:hypothetical protein